MGLTRLPRYVGRNRALDILLLSQDFDAKTAYDFGLVTRVVARSELADSPVLPLRTRCALAKAARVGERDPL